MSNPFDQFDAPAAEGGNPFDQFDAPAAKKLPSKGILSDVGGAFVEGAKSAGRAIAGTANIYAGDESALVEKAQAQESAQAQKPAALTAFNQAVTERVKPLGDDPGLLDSVKAIGGAVVDQPKGAGLAVVEQLPNAAPAIAGGMAGMKAGAALGTAIMPGVGTTIGAIGGGLAGMFLGNTAIETGYKGIEAAQDGAVTQDEMSRVKKEGAVKAGVITGVDALTLGLSKAVTNIPARAVESATRNALTKAGVNVADEAAVLAARQSPEISAAVRAAQESAFASANTLGKRAAAGGAALGLETVGEGLGEYLGELAATGKANVADAVLEAMMSLGQSGAEVAWGAARNKKAEQGGMWDTAEAKFQPPPPTLVTEPEPLQQRIDALMGIDTGAMSDKERTQYEKDLTAAFLEPVGVTQDEHGLEIPFTMADYLNAQVRAEDSVRARPLKQNAADQSGNRLQQLADEETQQQPDIPGYVAPVIPVVGTLSAAANIAVQSGAHAATVANQQQASEGFKTGQTWRKGNQSYTIESVSPDGKAGKANFGKGESFAVHFDTEKANGWSAEQNSQAEAISTKPGKADTPTTGNREAAPQLGILAGIAAQAPSIAQSAPNTQPQGQGGMPATAQQVVPAATSPAGVEFDVSKRTNQQLEHLSQHGQPGWKEAAVAEIAKRGAAAPTANSASVPALKASDSAKAPEIPNGDGVTNLPTEKRGIKTIDRWSAEELQGRLDRGNLSPESEQRLRAELAKRQPVKQSAPQASPLTVGKTPNGAEPVTVRNGVVHVGDYPAIDYETEADITVPEGATPQQIADALRNGGALGSRKIFGLKADEKQEAPAVDDPIGWTRMPTVEREALVAKAGWTGKTRGINLGGAIVAKQAWAKMSEANRAKLVAASQNPVKNESPDAATVSAEMAAPKQGPIKNQSGESTEMVNPVSQPKTDTAPEAKQEAAPVSTPQPDAALQNRDRGRAASVNQMQSIARNPDYMRLGPSRTPDSGAPMVFAVGGDTNKISPASMGGADIAVMADGQRVPFRYAVVDARSVEPSNFADGATNPAFSSDTPGTIKALNNGRTAGVRAAHEGNTAANYTAELLADQAHGVSPAAIRNTPNPMLVRVYAEQANTGDMAAKSQGQGLGMSASERATQDAELMTSDVLDKFAPGDIASAGNRDFVRAFVGKLAENELADMMDATGNLSQDGRRRIEAALLTAAYGKSDLVQELFESTDTDIKAIGNALKVMSGQWAAMRQAAKDGSIDPATDMTANLIEAVNIVRRSRAEGSSIAELAGQGDLMGGNYLNELSELFLRIFYKGKNYDRARGGDKVISALQEIVTSAMNTKAESGLFGDSFKATPKQIVESARSKIDEENKPASQSSLFGANGQATAVSQGNRSESAQKPGEVGSRPVSPGRGEEAGKQAEPVERSIADLQKALESAKFGERTELNGILIERVSEDAEQAIKQGEMPMYQTGQGTFVALHPSAQQDGMIQATRYSDTGVFGDSQYKEVKEAVRDNGLWFKRRLPDAEAARLLEQSIAAEAEYQERKNGASEPVAKAAEPAPAVDSKQSNDADLESRILIAADSIDKLRKVDVERVLMQGNIDRKQMADYIKRKRPEFSAEVDSVIEDATVEDNQKSEALDREMAGFTGVNDAEYELRQLSRKEKRDGDIELGNGKFVTLEQAVEAAKKSMDRADWSKPFQFNRILDIAPIDWNTMVGAMNTATVDAKKQEEAKPVALLSIAGREKFDPISLDTAAGVVARMRQTIKEVWKVDLRLVPTFSALPQEVKDAIAKYGEGTRAKGVLHKGSVYIVADEHASDADVETTILHEIKGHVGLRRLYSDAINKDLGALYMSIGGRRGLADLAKARGFTDELQGYAESLSNSDFTDEERTRIVMEELLSHIAQDPKFGDKVKAIVGKIRAWLRDNGFMALAKFGEADLLNILAKASKALETVRDDNGPVVLMTAWHGSPHDHDKFDSSKIGTGEGAQAYGYGHYFAGAKDVAEWYRRKLSGADNSSITFNGKQYGDSDAANRKLTNDVKKWAEETGRDPERIDVALEYLAGMAGDLGSARQLAAKEGLGISHWIYGTLNDLSEHLYPSPNGRLYQVELAPTADEYLDWDKPLSEQSEFVRNALTDKSHFIGEYLSDTLEIAKNNGVDFNERGDTLYKIVSDQYGSDKAASDYLHSIGIRGIRYLDGSSRSAGEGNSNYVIFNDADVSITAKYNKASKDKLTPADTAIYGMAAEGKSAAEVLKFIASASRSPFNRQVAKLLLKTGIAPSVTVGDGKGWKMNAGEGNKYAAGYNPKTDTISLFRPASSERNMLHELIHAATLKALSKKGMASAQMNALYQHVKKSGKLKGMYGMSDVDEFIAEAFSNPKFQAALKQVAAPSTSTAKSAWHWFVRVIKGILGLPSGSENALSQALEIGIGVMRENMRLNEGAGDVRYNAAPGKINQTDTEAFRKWFGDSRVVDADGKPMRVYHGTGATDIGAFNVSDRGSYGGGIYLTPEIRGANDYAIYRGAPSSTVYPVYAAIKNPASGSEAAQVASWKGEENAREELIRRGFDGVVDMRSGEIVAFYPEQIKSAIGNNGDFDGSNPDIRYNVADEGGDIGRIVGDSVSDQLKAAVLRLSGRPMLDHTDPFAAENARLREQDQSLWSKAKKQLRRYLAPGGLLPQSVFAEKIKRDSEFQAVEFDVRHLIGGLEQAVKADFGIAFDKLSKEQMRPITEALAGKVPASLPEATKTAAVAMRQYIDGMSTEYLKIIQQKIDAKMLKALESGKDSDKAQAINEIELFEKIKGNIGRYVHRSYQAFDDPKWFEKVPAHVLNASRLYLKQGYMEAGENDAKASQMAEVTLHEILKNGTAYDSMESFIAESKLGAKDLSVLMRRKEVPAQIRALLGEYPDARLNFTKSATKMGRLIWNTRFLDRVRDMGMGSFFFEGKDRPANATTQIAADGSEVYAPLNGLWTFPEIAQSFKDALGKEQMSDLYRAIVRFNGLVKYGKTVLAPTTAMRNWQSAMFFSLANGHFDLTQMKKSISAFREQVSQKATGQDLKYLRHLKQLGVVYDTPYAGEMARLMEDARMEELLSSDKGDAVRWFRKANQLAQGFYTFGDDFWKIIGFENEKAGLMKAGLSLQEAETEAAKRIRDTYPTYSMVGRGVQWLSRFPLAGTFVSFPAEIIRTSGNMLRTVAADLKSDNPKLRELGMKRAAGMVFVSAAFYSLAALSMAMAGVGDDEDEAIRDLAPEWQKNSTFLYLGRDEKGNLRYFDMSFLDPYGYWKRPITAMLRNQPWEDSLASGLRGMLEPFIGADIAAKAIFEAVANQKENGGKVYKEKDGAINQTIDVADHLRKALQPGVVGNVERLVKAAGDVRKSSGQPYSMEDELVALVGWRATTIDPKTALYYRSFEFTDAVAEARKTITETLRDANEITPEDIADAKARAQAKQEQAFKEMHRLVSAAESAGMSKMQIVQTLRLSNISQANIGSLMRGETPDVSITPQLAARAVRQASQMRGPEYAAEVFDRYRQARAN